MNIQLLSDLHNEFLRNTRLNSSHKWSGSIPVTDADVIILAGDIDIGIKGAEWAIEESKRLGKPIVYVLGNHEFYNNEFNCVKEDIAELCDGTNVRFLDCDIYLQDNIRFIGATLWTDYKVNSHVPQDLAMHYVNQGLADHNVIRYLSDGVFGKFKPSHALAIHIEELEWIKRQLAEPFDGKTVVVTHHGPHPFCQHPSFAESEISGAFQSDLDWLLAKNEIDLWVYGHTHANLDVTIANTRVISNQAGYPGENVIGFDASLVIKV